MGGKNKVVHHLRLSMVENKVVHGGARVRRRCDDSTRRCCSKRNRESGRGGSCYLWGRVAWTTMQVGEAWAKQSRVAAAVSDVDTCRRLKNNTNKWDRLVSNTRGGKGNGAAAARPDYGMGHGESGPHGGRNGRMWPMQL